MLVYVAHCDNQMIYMNSNCRVGIIRQYLIQKCPPYVPSRAVDLIDTSGSLVYLSWFPNNENAMRLFQPFNTYLLVYLIPIPKVPEAVRIVPTMRNYWKVYPDVWDKISKPMLLQSQNATNAQSTPVNPSAATSSLASATATPPASSASLTMATKLKGTTFSKDVKKPAPIFKRPVSKRN